jgi:hypothetical protein
MSDQAEKVDPASVTDEEIGQQIGDLVPEELDGVTKDKSFRRATALLVAGDLTVPEWQWFAVRAINKNVEIPLVPEATERDLFATALEAIGTALEGLLLQGESRFRAATVDLLRGEADVEDFLIVAGDVLDAIVEIPYLPAMGEELIFDRGLELIAKALHGLLVGSSEAAK